jgi:alpha-glucoside transport system substrate-binding protein
MEDRRRPEDLVGDPGKEKAMEEHIHRRSRIAVLIATVAIVAAACGSTSSSPSPAASTGGSAAPAPSTGGSAAPSSAGGGDLAGQSVTVIGTWGGDEQKAFLQMVAPWEAQTGAKVNYTGTRDLNTVLTTGVASGVLPDLAGLPGPGQMTQWADSLIDLGGVLDVPTYTSETAPALVTLGTVNGKLVGVFIKTAVKGLIWFNPKILSDVGATPPASWDALQTYITTNKAKAESPWCLGIESGAASGWPGTDWIEDIVLRQAGPDVYQQWYQGKVKWTDPAIKQAWTTFGDVVANSFGGASTVNATNFANAGDPLFKTPPGCMFLHQASFITGLGGFKTATAGTDYDFFQFPDINSQYTGAVEGAGDLFGMFHDTPAAKSLMAYLVTAPAQDIWVKIGGALSANKNATDYPDEISKRSAAILTNAKIFAFDASDLMPSAMNDAFWKGIVAYVKDPSQLDSILANLDTVQTDAYAAP